MTTSTQDRILIDRVAPVEDAALERRHLVAALEEYPPRIPSHYHYDARGSALFVEITKQPEYYLTRAERALLEGAASELAARTGATSLIELGPGDATKTRVLLDALTDAGTLRSYVPFDVDPEMIGRVAEELTEEYTRLQVHGLVGNFLTHLDHALPADSRRLVAFLGSTIGNLEGDAAAAFLTRLHAELTPRDTFALGIDLIKEPAVLEAAYNDAAGVTRGFSRNILQVMNRRFGFDFEPAAFEHESRWVPERHRIETFLRSRRRQAATSEPLGVRLELAPGDPIRTEISSKFDRPIVERALTDAGLRLEAWYTDPDGLVALALARRAQA